MTSLLPIAASQHNFGFVPTTQNPIQV